MTETNERNQVTYRTIQPDQAGQRLDNYLINVFKGAPRSLIYRIIRKGEVRVNKGRVKPLRKLEAGDLVRLPPVSVPDAATRPAPSRALADVLADCVLYEDDVILVLDKPSGLAVHGGSGVSLGLIEALRQLRPEQHFLELVHRLDRETSGCIVLAKKRSALRQLHADLRSRSVQKTYDCVVYGHWPQRQSRIAEPLVRQVRPSGERVVRVAPEGKPALTRYRVRQALGQGATWLEAAPVTGRTHQIRVHCQAGGHAILGDTKYLSDEGLAYGHRLGVRRLLLHARSLRFRHPVSALWVHVEAPVPPEFRALAERLQSTEGGSGHGRK